MSDLHIMRGDELPIQVHRGYNPSPADVAPIQDVYLAEPAGGFWTASVDPVTGRTAFLDYADLTEWKEDRTGRSNWQVILRPDARVVVVDTAEDYAALIDRYGFALGSPYFPVVRINWLRVAEDFDAIRFTRDGITVADTTPAPASPCFWVGHESTLWFRWMFTDVQPWEYAGVMGEPTIPHGHAPDAMETELLTQGLALPETFHPELEHGYLVCPINGVHADVALAWTMVRWAYRMFGGRGWFPETTDARWDLWHAQRWLAVVEIRNRRACGIATTCLTSWYAIWRAGATHAPHIWQYDQAVPKLLQVDVFITDPAAWWERATALVHQAAAANNVAADELAFRGVEDGQIWQWVQTFATHGQLYLAR